MHLCCLRRYSVWCACSTASTTYIFTYNTYMYKYMHARNSFRRVQLKHRWLVFTFLFPFPFLPACYCFALFYGNLFLVFLFLLISRSQSGNFSPTTPCYCPFLAIFSPIHRLKMEFLWISFCCIFLNFFYFNVCVFAYICWLVMRRISVASLA